MHADDMLKQIEANWSAYLDGELDAGLRQQIDDFLDSDHPDAAQANHALRVQRDLQKHLRASLTIGMPETPGADLERRVRRSLGLAAAAGDELSGRPTESINSTSMRNLSLVGTERVIATRRSPLASWPVRIAASLILVLGIGALAFFTQGDEDTAGQEFLADVQRQAQSIIFELGTGDAGSLREYAQRIGYSRPLPDDAKGEGGCSMRPVNIRKGVVQGRNYFALTLCSGRRDAQGDCELEKKVHGPSLRRMMLFVIEGNAVPPSSTLDASGAWVVEQPGCTTVAHYDKDQNQTLLVYIATATGAEEAREIAKSLLI